jgi:hypothetical protein
LRKNDIIKVDFRRGEFELGKRMKMRGDESSVSFAGRLIVENMG